MHSSSDGRALIVMPDRPTIDWPTWAASPPGRYVLDWEQAQLDRMVSDMFGFHALQLGLPQLDALRENRMPCRAVVLDPANPGCAPYALPGNGNGPHAPGGRSTTWCDLHDLPFESQSVDLIVMPHTLEFTSDPRRLLREVERVLLPEGRLVITGFNSLSLWGMTRRPFMASVSERITFIRLKDWIKLLGFELERGRFGCYRPPLATEQWLARYAFMEPAGDRWWPIFGAVYMVTAVKRTAGMHLIGPARGRKLPVRAAGLAPTPTPATHQEPVSTP
jgi:SAM-dependent methyltransferase